MGTTEPCWRHVIISTRGSWLHGDARGFRSRKHRIHSSGDYRNPPPAGEHAGLFAYQLKRSQAEVTIPRALRPIIGKALVKAFDEQHHCVFASAVGKTHAHILVELPQSLTAVKRMVGDAKRTSSRAVKQQMPGSVWAAGGAFKVVRDAEHQRNAYRYILYGQGTIVGHGRFAIRRLREGLVGEGTETESGAALRFAPA